MNERELFLTALLKCRREELYIHPRVLSEEEEARLAGMEARRKIGEPVQYITGYCEFMGLPLNVDCRVLIPRPETEILVDSALRMISSHFHIPPARGRRDDRDREKIVSERVSQTQQNFPVSLRILDIGTGSGNIAVAMAKFMENSLLTTLDISGDALDLARENAELNGVADRIEFVHAHINEYFMAPYVSGRFDVVIANPPYIPTAQLNFLPVDVQYEPLSALDGGEDGLYYFRLILAKGAHVLKPGGFLFFEVGDTQAAKVAALISSLRLSPQSPGLSLVGRTALPQSCGEPPACASCEGETRPLDRPEQPLFAPPQSIKDDTGMERVVWAQKRI